MEAYAPCDACAAPCCRENEVVLDGHDVFRIASTLKLPMEDFVDLRWVERPSGQYRIQLSAQIGDEPRWYSMVLRKIPDPDPRHRFRCVFLVTVGARGRCGVHPVRPASCAVFPTAYREGMVSIAGDDPCPKGAWRVESIDVPLHRARHLQSHRQSLVFDEVIAGWNQRVRFDRERVAPRGFFNYLHNTYREMAEREPSLFEENLSRRHVDERAWARTLVDDVLRELGWRTDETLRAGARA